MLGLCSITGYGFVVKVVEVPDSSLQGDEFVWYGCCGLRIKCITVCDNGNVIAVTSESKELFSSQAFDNAHVFTQIQCV